MSEQKTHREVKKPQITVRYLADFMAASEQARRTIARNCKYPAIARIIQHEEAKAIIGRFMREQTNDTNALDGEATWLREKLADSDFERDLYDHNADYVARFAKVYPNVALPNASFLPRGQTPAIAINGVRVTVEVACRVRRLTKTNKVRVGAVALRYAKNKALPPAVGNWQSAFLYGYLGETVIEEEAAPERKLCVTIDAQSGTCYPAPSDSIRRFHNMEAACATIAERWSKIMPPPKAIL